MSTYHDLLLALSDREIARLTIEQARLDLAQADERIAQALEALDLPQTPNGLMPVIAGAWVVRLGCDGRPTVERCVTLAELQIRDEAGS